MKDISITYAGHSAVFIDMAGTRIAIDPWLVGNPLCPERLQNPGKLDLIAVTHGHSDHASDVVRVAKHTGAKVAAIYELAMILIAEGIPAEQVIAMNKGGTAEVDGVTVSLTHALHSNSYDGKLGSVYAGEACGVIVSRKHTAVYHAGDTALFSDMKLIAEQHQPTIALLPIGDRFTMGPAEAALAASWLGCKVAVPIHYKTFGLLTGTYEEFARACDARKVAHLELDPGQTKAW